MDESEQDSALEAVNRPTLPSWSRKVNPTGDLSTTSQGPLVMPQQYEQGQRPRTEEDEEAFPHTAHTKLQRSVDITSQDFPERLRDQRPPRPSPMESKGRPMWLQAGRDFGGSESGMATPAPAAEQGGYGFPEVVGRDKAADHADDETSPVTDQHRVGVVGKERDWVKESGMGAGARADALGDQLEEGEGQIEEMSEEERRERGVRESVY